MRTSNEGRSGQERLPANEMATPLISLVIPVYNAEPYLAACLSSIAGQSFRNIEIIAVDGGSTDSSSDILDERAGSESRLTVIHSGRIGPGRARNIGAGHAGGQYLWFVDADDAIVPDCLAAIARNVETLSPDVLLVGYDVVYPSGRLERSQDHVMMSREMPTTFMLAEQPWVINLTLASWNKIIRREAFVTSGVTFEEIWPHEDIAVTCLLLLEARRLSVLSQACYRYRKDVPGSLMSAGDARRHFKVFDAWHAVLDQVRKQADTNELVVTRDVQLAFFQRAIWHCSAILDTRGQGEIVPFQSSGLVAPGDRREFFAKMHWNYVHYKPAEYRPPDGFRGVKFRLIQNNSYAGYRLLRPLNRLRATAMRGGRLASQSGWLR